ncbi:MAG: histidine triad nucleotide-binding protein [Oscillospiraceae bacterium]|nr:histidine triad nucleotide-binding protein [Oscillospiraceae bacterium]
MEDCLFCSIVKGDIPSTKVYEDDVCIAFRDINPLAPTHILVIPKEHITSCAELTEEHEALIGHIFTVIARLSKELGLVNGFRVVSNSGIDAGQTVGHLHFHVLAGKPMNAKMV